MLDRIVLGIDPGLNNTGWGVLHETSANRIARIASGKITTSPSDVISKRLYQIYSGLDEVISKYVPNEVAIEKTFVNTNPQSALTLGFARGVALMVPAKYNVPVYEYSPNTVKKMIVGVGHADKFQVAIMIKRLLNISESLPSDVSDSIAIALCHIFHKINKKAI